MKTIYLIRHCQATGQEPAAPLTRTGQEQAERLAEMLEDKGIEWVVSSPYVRAVETIKPFCERNQLPCHTDERLKERVLSTENYEDWLSRLKDTYSDLDLKFPGGESSNEAMSRGIAVLNELHDRPENNIAVVTHGALMSLILKHFISSFGFDDWQSLSNPDVYRAAVDLRGASISRIWE
ncbi:histidine phosphatase family protein [Paenibacillus sp. J2TS4]|uniref:histidine phosphatase family protein n=1 Tax=Paenibacillus sp. J2TS4 TaxID=2807194 RepID=UPI001B2A93BD|nr:histidine phosphatase family protein [Paenibacillus sp. J2TS4]GIP32159.1 phosphoglycerate mutase [Paenibacillus sp. J2TS4]